MNQILDGQLAGISPCCDRTIGTKHCLCRGSSSGLKAIFFEIVIHVKPSFMPVPLRRSGLIDNMPESGADEREEEVRGGIRQDRDTVCRRTLEFLSLL